MTTQANHNNRVLAVKSRNQCKKRGDRAVASESGGERGIRTGGAASKASKYAGRAGNARTGREPKHRQKTVAKQAEDFSGSEPKGLRASARSGKAEDFSGNKQAAPAKVAQGRERSGKAQAAEREPSGTMSSSAQVGTQTADRNGTERRSPRLNVCGATAPERSETASFSTESLTMSEVMSAAKAALGKLPILAADTFFLRDEYAASVLGKPRKWEHVSTAAILRLGAGRAFDCVKELRRLEELFEEIRKRFEKVRHRFAGDAGATGTPAGSIPAPRTPPPCRAGKQTKKAKGRVSAKGGKR